MRLVMVGTAVLRVGLALGLTVRGALGQEARRSVTARVDAIFKEWNRTDAPGCAVAVVQNGKVVLARAYGMANLENSIPLTTKSVIDAASVTKEFTGMAIALLAGDGKLSLDDDVRKYVPEVPDFGTPITIRQLLHHTSGLRDVSMFQLLADWRDADNYTYRDMLNLVSRQKELNFKPGEQFHYTNTNYLLLAEVVKRVTGKSLRDFGRERIFEPLGMHDTQFVEQHTQLVRNRARGYLRIEGGQWRNSEEAADVEGYGHMVTSVEDLARWEGNFLNPVVGGKAAIAEMTTPGRLNSGRAMDYGYGFGLWLSFYAGGPPPYADDYLSSMDALPDTSGDYVSRRAPNQPLRAIWHSGTGWASRAGFIRFPDEHLAVAVLCNTDVPDVGRPLMQTADVFLADRLKQVVKPSLASGAKAARTRVELSPERRAELPALAGLYHSPRRFAVWHLTAREGRMFVTGADRKEQELVPIADGRFLLATPAETATVAFSRPASGARAEMTVQYEGAPARRFEPVEEAVRTPAKLAEYIGTYYSPELDVTYSVVLQDTMLVVRRQRRGDAPMVPMFADGFRVIDFGQMRFVRDHMARVTGFYVTHWAGAIWHLSFVRRTPDSY